MCDAAPIRDGTRVHYFGPGEHYAVQGYVAAMPASLGHSPVQCVASFRGSVNFQNWVADAQLWMVTFPNDTTSWCEDCKVHRGFEMAYEELRPMFHDAVHRLQCSSVHITAHSLGAAVGTLAAVSLRVAGVEAPAPVLFGAPRVGNAAFARAFAALARDSPSAWRVVHNYDPVPRLGARELGYEHVGREVLYTEDSSSFHVCSAETSEDPTCANAVPLARCVVSPNLFDHLTYMNLTFRHTRFPSGCHVNDENTDALV
eukprot:CAMPEP_0194527848 /NCGR_PEP_ID=MMETSP0253-20130528/64085_1 /TAXON_ID=2966 /ORGANISM="Noctiluca scintillans" /LENGTH=257 /DNA_ID=CAMNT_0039372843 /DNA_START=126 /DNA_END=899 /DNA_ORIENTATION=-